LNDTEEIYKHMKTKQVAYVLGIAFLMAAVATTVFVVNGANNRTKDDDSVIVGPISNNNSEETNSNLVPSPQSTIGAKEEEEESPHPSSSFDKPTNDKSNDYDDASEQADVTNEPSPSQSEFIFNTLNPTTVPSGEPSNLQLTESLTSDPTVLPTDQSSQKPTMQPTKSSTKTPTRNPSRHPTAEPTHEPTIQPTDQDIEPLVYRPGNLTTQKVGLLLSEGLDARLIATTDEKVVYGDGSESNIPFHGQPDAGACFPDERPENPGGWIYVSNSEMQAVGTGGVGGFTFDRDGNLLDYRMILSGTSMNCGGGRTPWGTWVSGEEIEFDGRIYQVDPYGERGGEVMTLGSSGGRWESFAYDVRNRERPHFFATEDHSKGTVRRFTPDNPNWDDPWNILHGEGVVDFLMIFPNATNNGGTFVWTNDKEAAKNNARSYYPQTEGIDVYGSQMYFVCKRIKQVFSLDLDEGTYWNRTTITGLFDGQPDQMQRILGDGSGLLYFTEEGGKDAGIHARDALGRFYTILESPVYTDETTGLAFSPDGRHMYLAYQSNGLLFDVWREDGFPFNATQLDVKYHRAQQG
jgi:hypothetical protein